ncbi:MAG: hypothetical protein HC937_04015 [Aquincola sp.]|nr:hypothetical protein [Aquincola sp.]
MSLAEDPRFSTNAGRVTHRAICVDAVQRQLRSAPAAVWDAALCGAGVPVGEVRSVREALADSGASASTGVPSSVGGHVFRPPPRLGEHSDEIRRHGWGNDQPEV